MPQGPFLREYGTEAKIPFVLFEIDGVDFRSDATPATADASVMIDEGAVASATNIYVDEGVGYSITLTATEMLGARIIVYMVDAATKAYLDDSLTIETYGSSAAMHQFPFGTATVTVGVNNDKADYLISGTKTTLDALTDGSGVTVTTNSDKTGYSISGTKTTLDALTDGSGVTVTTSNDKTGYSISGTKQTLDALTDGSGVTVTTNSDKTGYNIVAGALSAGAFAASAITASALGTGAITSAKFAAGAITAAAIATGAIDADALAAGTITSAKYAADAITGSALAASAIDLVWDEVVDGTTTARESFVISNTLLAGLVSGGSSTTGTWRDLADTKDRIVIIFTEDGDKTTVTLSDLT